MRSMNGCSFDETLKVGVVSFENSSGPSTRLVSGSVTSTIQMKPRGSLSLPRSSTERTSKPFMPAGRSVRSTGESHSSQAVGPGSQRHSKRSTVASSLENSKWAVVAEVNGFGASSRSGFGAVRSICQAWVAGDGSSLPAGSLAKTLKVWLPSARPA
jgi:hypothetical protein